MADLYDAEAFRRRGHELVDLLADHLARTTAGDGPVVDWRSPEDAAARWPATFPAPGATLRSLVERLLADSVRQHHPRYVGYQVAPALPLAALGELVGALLNNGMAAFDAGPAGSAMEAAVVRWMTRRVGWGDDADGVLTSGGSLGNLTALLAARADLAARAGWGDAAPPLCLLAPATVHYSVTRAARAMGWGDGGVVPVEVDDAHRLRPDALPSALAAARAAGRRVVAVVANGGSTVTGGVDPLGDVAAFCAAEGLWLHVDAAHGAGALVSERYRHLLAGLERADSLVWDAHKLLAVPALSTGVLFRRGEASWGTFEQEASYLYGGQRRALDRGLRTVECTKRMLSVPLYLVLALVPPEALAAAVDATFDRARDLAARLQGAPDFALAVAPDCNIVCFRHRAPGVSDTDLDALQDRIRDRLLADGRVFLARTGLAGRVWLRATVMNPLTAPADLDALVAAVRAAGRLG